MPGPTATCMTASAKRSSAYRIKETHTSLIFIALAEDHPAPAEHLAEYVDRMPSALKVTHPVKGTPQVRSYP